MPDNLLRQIAIVSESDKINPRDVAKVSAALQKQAKRDLVQFWAIDATVDAFPKLEDVPVGYWPIMIMDDIQTAGAAGVHEDKNGQPFALVTASDKINEWSLTTSHEMLEMLIDPFGNRLVASDSPKADQGRVQILVEACDPSEDARYSYTANGILVSDFYSPNFFDPIKSSNVRYSFTGAIQEPRQVLRGGYLSWHDLESDIWWQETWFDGEAPTFRSLGKLSAQDGSFRSQVDAMTAVPKPGTSSLQAARGAGLREDMIDRAAEGRAQTLREHIRALTAKGPADRLKALHDSRSNKRSPDSRRGRPATPGLRSAPSVREDDC